jgi:hypothetical protein
MIVNFRYRSIDFLVVVCQSFEFTSQIKMIPMAYPVHNFRYFYC